MILDQNEIPADAARVFENREWLVGVVQNIHEQAPIKRAIRKWKMAAIEGMTFDGTAFARKHFDSGYAKSGQGLLQERAERAIAATNIKQLAFRRQEFRETLGQYRDAARRHQAAMQFADRRDRATGALRGIAL
jgi:hypothetical protein